MKRIVNNLNQLTYATPGSFKKSLLLPGLLIPLWQEPPDQTQWLRFILFSSPIVAIIVLLVIAIFVLLLYIWLRNKRRQASAAGKTLSSAPPVEVDVQEEAAHACTVGRERMARGVAARPGDAVEPYPNQREGAVHTSGGEVGDGDQDCLLASVAAGVDGQGASRGSGSRGGGF